MRRRRIAKVRAAPSTPARRRKARSQQRRGAAELRAVLRSQTQSARAITGVKLAPATEPSFIFKPVFEP